VGLDELVWRVRDIFERRRRRDGPLVEAVTADEVVIGGDATWALRESTSPFWQMLRQRLKEQGIDPAMAEVVDSYEKGSTRKANVTEVGVLITADEQVIEYGYSYKNEQWTTWIDRTQNWSDAEYSAAVERALRRRAGSTKHG
jgi:hypothetical protein